MTRKDYELIADAIRKNFDEMHKPAQAGARRVAGNLADALAEDNPRFDRVRFLKACGIE